MSYYSGPELRLQALDETQYTDNRDFFQAPYMKPICLTDQNGEYRVLHTTNRKSARTKPAAMTTNIQLFSDWVLEPGDVDNAVPIYGPGDCTVHWPQVLQDCYSEWISVVRKVEEVREHLATQLSSRGSTEDDRERFQRIRPFHGLLLKEGGMLVRMGDAVRVQWKFARLGPFGDPVEFRTVARHFKLDIDDDLGAIVKDYCSGMEDTVRLKDEIAERLLMDELDLQTKHSEIDEVLPGLECRVLLVRATLNSIRDGIHSHDLIFPQGCDWDRQTLLEELGQAQEKLTVKRSQIFEVMFQCQVRQTMLEYLQEAHKMDIPGMRDLIRR